MTQDEFYAEYSVLPHSKEQRLVLDLRDREFTWNQIAVVFSQLIDSPYDWRLQFN